MDKLFLNTDFADGSSTNRDILSVFRPVTEGHSTIHQGMTTTEISEVVSERIIAVIQEQFQAVQVEYEAEAKNS